MARSEQARAAAMIRKHLKAHGINARVTSDSGSMTSSVNVTIKSDVLPAARKEIDAYCNQFQYGHFNGMEDIYEYSNGRDDLPQAKFVFVEYEYSDEIKQEAFEYLCATFGGYQELTGSYEDNAHKYVANEHVATMVYRILNGFYDYIDGAFWTSRKPRVRAAS